jgi:hypothetical protein
MPLSEKMGRGQSEYRIIMAFGIAFICILALIFAVNVIVPTLETNREGQAKSLAILIATSVDSLSGVDAGFVERDFGLKEPMDVEIYDKGSNPQKRAMYVKVTYDKSGKSYEVPIISPIDPVARFSGNRVSVIKGMDGRITLSGSMSPSYTAIQRGDKCTEPSNEMLRSYIGNATKKTGLSEALIKAVITRESSGFQCNPDGKGGYYESGRGALGLMQLTQIALRDLRNTRGVDINPYDAEQNVLGGSYYLSDQIKRFAAAASEEDRIRLGLAAYNAGPTFVMNAAKTRGYSWSSVYGDMPGETQRFVPVVYSDYYQNCYLAMGPCKLTVCRLC